MDSTNRNTALASALTEELARCGVRRAVVSPGSRSTPLAVALWRQPGIEVTIAVDERSGGFFALGAAQASGRPVVLLCTSGTAAANYHPAVAEADLSSVPLIVLTADRPPELRDTGAGQTIDQIKLYGSAVRWFCEVGTHDADDAGLIHFRATACRAFATAGGEPRPGPVHLNVPFRDPLAPVAVPGAVSATKPLALTGRGDSPLTSVLAASPQAPESALGHVASVLAQAERPMLVAGRQTSPELRESVSRFAQRHQMPILAEPTSQLRCGPHDRSRVVSHYDSIAQEAPPELAPDLVIRIGEMPTSKALRTWLGGIPDLHQIVIDPQHAWYEPLRTADFVVRAEAGPLLDSLTSDPPDSDSPGFVKKWLEADRHEEEAIDSRLAGRPGSAAAVHRELAGLHRDGDLVYTASSMAIRDQERFLPGCQTDLLFLANRGANGIDGLLASGIGAAASIARPATVITGDLGFQHDLGSLALLSSSGVPVRVVVINDGGGRIFSRLPQKQAMETVEFDVLMRTPSGLNVEAAASLFDVPYFQIGDPSQLSRAFASGTAVIEVPVSH